MKGEIHIFDKKRQFNGGFDNPNKSLIVKIVWRLFFRKITLDDITWMKGRCLDCDARGDDNPAISCGVFYCPCDLHQHLKLK